MPIRNPLKNFFNSISKEPKIYRPDQPLYGEDQEYMGFQDGPAPIKKPGKKKPPASSYYSSKS